MPQEQKFLPTRECWNRFYSFPLEIRTMSSDKDDKNKYSGVIDSWTDNLIKDIKRINRNQDIYATLNPVSERLLKRKKITNSLNKIENGVTGNADIEKLRWIFVDIDPLRPSGTSSTDSQRVHAQKISQSVKDYLDSKQFYPCVLVDSGNGKHLYYRIDLDNSAENVDLVKRFLEHLSSKFTDEVAKIDTNVYNAGRIVRLQGTYNRKGESTPENPHKKCGFVEFPDNAENLINSKDTIEDLVGKSTEIFKELENLEPTEENRILQKDSFDFAINFLDSHEINYKVDKSSSSEYKISLDDGCPFNAEHNKDKVACILVYVGGKIVFKCFHDSCKENHWKEFVRLYEPDYLTASERQERDAKFLEDILAEYGNDLGEYKEDDSKIRLKMKGKVVAQISHNYTEVLNKDPEIKNMIGENEQAQRPYNLRTNKPWKNVDEAELIQHIELHYGLTKREAFRNAMDIHMHKNRYNPLTKLIEGIEWDGIPRVETALVDYLGSEDCEYTRGITKVMFLGAIWRAFEPGCQFDTMVVLVGAQGFGKSTFCRRLALEDSYFTDNLKSTEGKDAFNTIRGSWIIEWGEMAVMKSVRDADKLKQFVTQRSDEHRMLYREHSDPFPRRSIFIGTTNEDEFLTDWTGNRRYIPVRVGFQKPTKNIHDPKCVEEFKQMMAEAYKLFKEGQKPLASESLSKILIKKQEEAVIQDPRIGMIKLWIQKHPEVERLCVPLIQERVFKETLPSKSSRAVGSLLTHKCNLIKKGTYNFREYGTQKHWTRDETWKDIPAPTHEDELAEGQYELDKLNYTEFEEI